MKKIRALSVFLSITLLTACGGNTVNEFVSVPASVTVSVSQTTASSFVSSASSSVGSVNSTVSSVSPYASSIKPPISFESSVPNKPLCTGCAFYCVEDGELVHGENINDRIAPASLTKLLTAVVALKHASADEVFTVGTELSFVQPESSLALIAMGQKLKLYDLITGMLLPSGNDAAYTVAVSVARKASGSADMSDERAVEYFCGLMNDMARELGMYDSHFADPDGWDDDRHYTTVSDLVKLAEYALTVPEIREIVSTPRKSVTFETGEVADWVNGNVLIQPEWEEYYRPNAIGMKTGSTDNAGYCLIGAFTKTGKTYITVVVGSELWEDRYDKTLRLIDSV